MHNTNITLYNAISSMAVYFTNVDTVEELSDLIIDNESHRQLELIRSDISGLQIRKVFSDSGIAWVDEK